MAAAAPPVPGTASAPPPLPPDVWNVPPAPPPAYMPSTGVFRKLVQAGAGDGQPAPVLPFAMLATLSVPITVIDSLATSTSGFVPETVTMLLMAILLPTMKHASGCPIPIHSCVRLQRASV